MCAGYDRQTGAAQITAQELQDWLDDRSQEVVIFDTREGREHSVSALPGARLLTPSIGGMAKALAGVGHVSFQTEIPKADTIPEMAKVVCHCTAGLRSGFACAAIQREWKSQGVDRTVFNLHGGIIAWVNAGCKVVDPAQGDVCNAVHTFGSKWQPYVKEREDMRAVIAP